MIRLAVLVVASILLLLVSRKSLFRPGSHGFFRFFAFESIVILILLNLPFWFVRPLAPIHILSWLSLTISLVLVVAGVHLLRSIGGPDEGRDEPGLYSFEKTSKLVTVGLYAYIRHPLYSSLLFLSLGAFLKDPSRLGTIPFLLSVLFLYMTARRDEAECIRYFGEEYRTYMRRTRMFVPFLF
jgi:protein-S-isoprenylcysteine O-methyltransferase Ste14